MDFTIISAPSSTKNRKKERDPEAHQVKKGNAWYFGYKAHIGVDKKTGLVHHMTVTGANVHDVTVVPKLLTGKETEVYGDSGYLEAEKREDAVTHILGLLKPTSGKAFFDGKPRDLKSFKARRAYWQKVQLIFQDPFSSFNIFDIINTVLLDCIKLMGKKDASSSEKFDMMKEACGFVNMKFEELTNKYPFELSGGQMQRLMLARVFMLRPKLVIADEPTSMIDACSRASILNSLLKLRDETNITIVFITHDIGLAYYISDRIYIMEHGKFVENGFPDDVILNPTNDYTRHLISDVPKYRKAVVLRLIFCFSDCCEE